MANLNSTQLATSVGPSDTIIPLLSLSGISRGDVLFVDKEAMPISALLSTSNPVAVRVARTGVAAAHGPGALVYTGPPSAFAPVDPVGIPPIGVQPYWVNTRTGAIWVAQGDETGPGALNRFWQLQTSTPGKGALGVRTVTIAPTQAV